MSSPLLGIYDDRMDVLREMERWLGRRHTIQTVFTPWTEGAIDELFEHIFPEIWDAGRVPLLTWEPYTEPPETTDAAIATRIIDGEFDAYLDTWATRLADWLAGSDGKLGTADDRRLYLRLAHEMNGDWYPWSPTAADRGITPEDYVEMWRHVHDHVERAEIQRDHLQWVWCVNHVDVGPHSVEELYPGDSYVDWMGVDGFNWGRSQEWSAWRSPAETFSEMVSRLRALADKPCCVPEVGCSSLTESGHDPEKKAAWIRDAFAYFDDADLEMACWFNEDKETDWAVFGGERGTDRAETHEAYPAYRDAITELGRSEPTGARLLSDAAFFGG